MHSENYLDYLGPYTVNFTGARNVEGVHGSASLSNIAREPVTQHRPHPEMIPRQLIDAHFENLLERNVFDSECFDVDIGESRVNSDLVEEV